MPLMFLRLECIPIMCAVFGNSARAAKFRMLGRCFVSRSRGPSPRVRFAYCSPTQCPTVQNLGRGRDCCAQVRKPGVFILSIVGYSLMRGPTRGRVTESGRGPSSIRQQSTAYATLEISCDDSLKMKLKIRTRSLQSHLIYRSLDK